MTDIERLIELARSEVGYIEKNKGQDLYKKEPGGTGNLTKYAKDLTDAGVNHPNGYAWCMTFICWLYLQIFGKDRANDLMCGMLKSASTMNTKDAFVKAKQTVELSKARPGDIVFRSRSGGGHVGLVTGIDADGKIVTVEGNTDGGLTSWNGGTVAIHHGAPWEWCCRPAYEEEAETVTVKGFLTVLTDLNIRTAPKTGEVVGTYKAGTLAAVIEKRGEWFRTLHGWISGKYLNGWIDQGGRWWYLTEGYHYPVKTVETINGKDYAFDKNGWMVDRDHIADSGELT